LDRAIHIPLRAGLFEALGHDLFAATFDGAAANQVTRRAELVRLHPSGIVGKVSDSLAGFFATRRESLTRLDNGRHLTGPQVTCDLL
jgi:hypothetical protein